MHDALKRRTKRMINELEITKTVFDKKTYSTGEVNVSYMVADVVRLLEDIVTQESEGVKVPIPKELEYFIEQRDNELVVLESLLDADGKYFHYGDEVTFKYESEQHQGIIVYIWDESIDLLVDGEELNFEIEEIENMRTVIK